ncbi:TetR/AcrR family transcriptional regulator [Aeromicrobium sp. IC_218]|uniref:TetR/AcrR family transcriptional regulator n=1 Tax=Aeromicrobium sp. IC_218 TaxID=2545468 RepID=UPI00103BC77D|nr:TetR/AcrR family transcriptional regulator [Aeromicrobium sp. IC_218]TCI96348.1 TetR/AcrR family transcriptional regulator [Aeromicrobium sp. IC_218]
MAQTKSRSAVALRDAVVELAQQKPADQINVSELCRAAGITRDTFYRYAASPIQLLAQVLNDDLDTYTALTRHLPAAPAGGTVMDAPSRAWLEHVCRFEAVYRQALRPHLPTEMRDVLLTRIQNFMLTHAARHPHIRPNIDGTVMNERGIRLAAAYAASGSVGAIEAWLASGPIGDLAVPTALIHASAAPWWFSPVDDK